MSGIYYRPATAAAKIAEELIPEHHMHLIGIEVRFVFRSKAAKSGGRRVWGKCHKKGGLVAFLAQGPEPDEDVLAGDFFVVELAEDVWARLNDKERRALVDHELCHTAIEYDDEGQLVLKTKGPTSRSSLRS